MEQTTRSAVTKEIEISILINALYYFLQAAIIVHEKDTYRLIVIQDKRVVMDESFPVGEVARTNFNRNFKPEILSDVTKAEWGIFLKPEIGWFEENGMRVMTEDDTGREYVITVI